ncbi:MAG: biotin--[acetyl-CoA-carboxylase] ligase [Oligoflexia bacterium]|nr:biotin--[acetyl-CoA-carboxylase] ligase [Oligoflexia bacterium]
MKQIHLKAINSTQDYLKENIHEYLEKNIRDLIVSTSKQTNGYGRNGRIWDYFENALAFSFLLPANQIKTLTSLEIAILIIEFLSIKYKTELYLKWPNDILNSRGEKCGGILLDFFDQNLLIVGVGLNLANSLNDKIFFPHFEKYISPAGYIFDSAELLFNQISKENFKKEMPLNIYNYIIHNRKNSEDIINCWNKLSIHINKLVKIIETAEEKKKYLEGIFIGIGASGEALIKIENEIKSVFVGSLILY